MSQTVVSFIVVAYRSNDFLPKLLDSIRAQQGDFGRQLVIVDNDNQEPCEEVVHSHYPAATLIVNSQNRGYTAAVNQGIEATYGDYLFLLNPDVELSPDCTRILVDTLKSVPAAAAAPQLRYPDGAIQTSVRSFPTFTTLIYEQLALSWVFKGHPIFDRWRNRGFDHKVRAEVEQPMASALMLKREAVKATGLWDERFFVFFSDVDYCKRLLLGGWKIIFEPRAYGVHLVGGSTRRTGLWLIKDSHRGFYRYLSKYELKGGKILLKPLAGALLSIGALLRIVLRLLKGGSF